MKTRSVLLWLVLSAIAAAQQPKPAIKAVIVGVVSTHEGEPAGGLTVAAMPLGVQVDGVLPHAKTNRRGEYRFENLPWLGRYAVYADDEKAGYSYYSTGTAGEAEVTTASPRAEFSFSLPPKAGFISVQLTSRRTGAPIRMMTIALMPMDKPDARLFTDPRVSTTQCDSDHIILVPPEENLLLHIKSDGFREWDESVGEGKPVNVPSGSTLMLYVQLEPAE